MTTAVLDLYQVILDCAKANLEAMTEELEKAEVLSPYDKDGFLVFLMEGIFGYLLGSGDEIQE